MAKYLVTSVHLVEQVRTRTNSSNLETQSIYYLSPDKKHAPFLVETKDGMLFYDVGTERHSTPIANIRYMVHAPKDTVLDAEAEG